MNCKNYTSLESIANNMNSIWFKHFNMQVPSYPETDIFLYKMMSAWKSIARKEHIKR